MPVYSLLAYSNPDLGRAATSIATGTFTVTGAPAVMQVRDNDARFDDESANSGQTFDSSQQTLATAFDGTYASGRVVQSVYSYTVTNNTTGETGRAYLIRIYTGSNPNNPGAQSGAYYNAFTIPVYPGNSITLSAGNYIGQVNYSDLVICFAAGTAILTDRGERPVHTLREGDRIATRDNGYQPLRWIGQRRLVATAESAPVHIAAHALDNRRDLLVSPNHRMLIEAASADLHFAEREVLVKAKHLVGNPGITRRPGGRRITYVHLLFDDHQIVFANGPASESFFPGKQALDALDDTSRTEVLSLFPALATPDSHRPASTARLCLSGQESRILARSGW